MKLAEEIIGYVDEFENYFCIECGEETDVPITESYAVRGLPINCMGCGRLIEAELTESGLEMLWALIRDNTDRVRENEDLVEWVRFYRKDLICYLLSEDLDDAIIVIEHLTERGWS